MKGDGEKFITALPYLLKAQLRFQSLLVQHDADLARKGRQPEMVKRSHDGANLEHIFPTHQTANGDKSGAVFFPAPVARHMA